MKFRTSMVWWAGLVLTVSLFAPERARGSSADLIFPPPRSIEVRATDFAIDAGVSIALPPNASEGDTFLARFLAAELSDRYGMPVLTRALTEIRRGTRVVLMGTVENPLVRRYCADHGIRVSARDPGAEGYVLDVTPSAVVVAGSDARGAFYGLQSLRQLLRKQNGGVAVRGVHVRDWPYKPFRAIKLYVPGPDNIPFFKRFVRDFAALYKFNRIVMEMNAVMRLDRHPEINAGWIDFAKDLDYTRRDHPRGPEGRGGNSSHQDAGDGRILEKEEVAGLVAWANRHYIEIIPEMPSLSHCYYLLTRHRELAEVPQAEWPDTYCPLNPKSYDLLFDVLDEYIDVMKPKLMHMGHDEWEQDIQACPRCRGKDTGELFAQDVNRIHDYLAKKGVRMAIWGDYLMEQVRGRGPMKRRTTSGQVYYTPGALTPAQVRKIPKDILIFNWFWGEKGQEANDAQLSKWGFEQVYGNFRPGIEDYARRSVLPGVMGGAPSAWTSTTEFNFGKDVLYEFAGCAELVWSAKWGTPGEIADRIQRLMPTIRRNLGGQATPSEDGEPVATVNLKPYFNTRADEKPLGIELGRVRTGRIANGNQVFDLADGAVVVGSEGAEGNSLPREAGGIEIGEDASSLIFLHACARRAGNEQGHRYIYNFPDTADLLGWYEVEYEDGFVETVPIRYSLNILEWNWGAGPDSERFLYLPEAARSRTRNEPSIWANSWYSYRGEEVDCGRDGANPIRFFAFEWRNPRFGKVIREVRLKGSTRFTNFTHQVIPSNAVVLAAISVVKKR